MQSNTQTNSKESPEGWSLPREDEAARVLWVGNVPRGMRESELREVFTASLPEGSKVHVTHVRVKRQRRMAWDAATIFLNRRVSVIDLITRMSQVRPQVKLLVRKCRGTSKRDKRQAQAKMANKKNQMTWGQTTWMHYKWSQCETAQAAARYFFENVSTPPPPVCTVAQLHFMRELENGAEDTFALLGLRSH